MRHREAWSALAVGMIPVFAALMVVWPAYVFGPLAAIAFLCAVFLLKHWWPFNRPDPPSPGGASTSTIRGGALSGDVRLKLRSSADHVTHDTDVGDRVQLDIEHHPGQPPSVTPDTDLESADGEAGTAQPEEEAPSSGAERDSD